MCYVPWNITVKRPFKDSGKPLLKGALYFAHIGFDGTFSSLNTCAISAGTEATE